MGILCNPKHPLFEEFPTGMTSDWQWRNLVQGARVFVLDDAPTDYQPLVHVIDNFARNHRLGVVFEGRVGNGQLLVCGLNVSSAASDPAVQQWLTSLYHYTGSAKFNPGARLNVELLDRLFPERQVQLSDAKVRADSEAPGYAANHVIENDPDTLWHTPWNESAPQFPHELVVELAKPMKLTGITCLPRQDGTQNGWIKDYDLYTSADGRNWGEPAAKGAFPQDDELHAVKFVQPTEARFLKLVARSSFDRSKPYASLAKLNLVPE
jgi:hypothetical protein